MPYRDRSGEFRCGCFCAVVIHIRDDDIRTFSGKSFGNAFSEPLSAACDDRDLSGKSSGFLFDRRCSGDGGIGTAFVIADGGAGCLSDITGFFGSFGDSQHSRIGSVNDSRNAVLGSERAVGGNDGIIESIESSQPSAFSSL